MLSRAAVDSDGIAAFGRDNPQEGLVQSGFDLGGKLQCLFEGSVKWEFDNVGWLLCWLVFGVVNVVDDAVLTGAVEELLNKVIGGWRVWQL